MKKEKDKSDYSYTDNGEVERCDNCGSLINSHGYCPLCDY